MNKVKRTLALITMEKLLQVVIILLLVLGIKNICFSDTLTKQCYICKQQVEDKDICLEATVDVTEEKCYLCFSCLANKAQDRSKIQITIINPDWSAVEFSGVIAHWGIYKDFINPQNEGIR